jgi:hypothetical protein
MYKKLKSLATQKIKSEFSEYALHDQFYKAGAAVICAYLLIVIVTLFTVGQEYINFLMKIFVFIIICTCTMGVAVEHWPPLKLLFSKTWFKWILGAISILIYKYAEAQSHNFINQLTGLDPSFFPFSSFVLTAVYLPYCWLVAVSSFLSIYIFFHWLFIPFEKPQAVRSLKKWKYIARFLGLMVIFAVANNLIHFFEDPSSLSSLIAKEIVLTTEYFPKSHCLNIEDHEISADIGRGYISIFDKNNEKFHTEKCER